MTISQRAEKTTSLWSEKTENKLWPVMKHGCGGIRDIVELSVIIPRLKLYY